MSSSPSLPCPFFAIRSFLLCLFLLTLGIVRAAPVHEGLASFGSKPQLPSPGNLVLGPNDYFWGTTKGGGAFGQGAIYKVKADGSDWQTVVEFTGNGTTNKGGNPLAGLTFDNLNTFWGTTSSGGAFNYGTVFKFDATTGVLTTLVEFTGNGASEKGASPSGKLTRDSSGYYWGTTSGGGSSNLGTVFRVHIQSGSLTTAIEFTGNGASNKGSYPSSGLISDFAGNFWGMTENGGAGGSGTIFKINLSSGILTTVIEFTGETGANKGRNPAGDLTGNGSDFWGTTQNGGANGFGTVFKLNRTTGILTTVVEFTYNGASNKGQRPQTTLRLDGAGNFWGTTQTGGSYSQGTVFKLDSTTGTLTTVIEFTGNTFTNKGSTPQAGFSADSAGSLWSCTYWGGASGGGTVFKLNPATGVLTTVLEFPGGSFTKGTSPVAGLTPDGAGFLWGSTSTGGTTGLGTLFKIAAPAAPSLTASVLTTVVHFTGNGASNKGSAPQATLRPDGASNLWGATLTGGANGHGTVFKVNISTGVLTTLVEFTGNAATNKGSQPRAELLDDGSGFFWGTTSLGGAGDHGTVFKINTALGLLTTVAEFTGTGGATIGRTPCGGLVADGGGYLWGTTASGGTGGFGTVYKIHATSGAFTSVLEFTGNGASNKGAAPRSRLTPDGAGYLWGTTEDGALGDGTVFKVHIATGQMTTVVQFTGNGPTNRGNHPLAALTSDGSGRLWGSTRSGGTGGQGTVFSILTNTGVLTTELDLTGNGPQANNGSSPGSGALYFHSDGRLYGTTSDGGPNHDGTVFRLHFEGAPEIIVQGFDGSPLTDNVGSTAIGPVRLKTPFISTINIRNDGYFPLSVASIAISCDGSAPGPISLKDVRSYDSLGNLRWSQFGQLPPTIAS